MTDLEALRVVLTLAMIYAGDDNPIDYKIRCRQAIRQVYRMIQNMNKGLDKSPSV